MNLGFGPETHQMPGRVALTEPSSKGIIIIICEKIPYYDFISLTCSDKAVVTPKKRSKKFFGRKVLKLGHAHFWVRQQWENL